MTLHRFAFGSITAFFLLIASSSQAGFAPGWSGVVEAARRVWNELPGSTKFPDVNDARPEAVPPPIDGESNMGTSPTTEADFTCPAVDPVKVVGAGMVPPNVIAELEFGFPCACLKACPVLPTGIEVSPTPGMVLKFWQAAQIVEVVRHRGCFPSVLGQKIPMGYIPNAARSAGGEDGFYHVHVLPNKAGTAPKFGNKLEEECHIEKDVNNTPYFSEIDLSWNPNNPIDFLVKPDLEFLAKKALWALDKQVAGLAQIGENLLCIKECTEINLGGNPDSTVGNCSGCNGLVAPYTGQVTGIAGERAARLLIHRYINLLMNRFNPSVVRTSSFRAWCSSGFESPSPSFPKNDFRMQFIYQADSAEMAKIGAFVPIADEKGKQGDFPKQDYVALLWQRRECCVTEVKFPCFPLPFSF